MAGRLVTLIFTISLLSVCPLTPAGAIQIRVSFTAVSFTEFEEALPAPMDPVTGSIVYDAASTTSNINSLTSINLTIAGHTYQLSEVGFRSDGSNQSIYGLSFGEGMFHHTDDFDIRWNQTTLVPFGFSYTTTSGGFFGSATFTQFSVTEAAAVTSDFNGDGFADILWQNTSGEAYIWELNGASVIGRASLGNPGQSWHIKGTGDFKSDGFADILWQNDSGEAYIWEMNGTSVIDRASLGNPGSSWHVIGN
jgi:hypothetical protein